MPHLVFLELKQELSWDNFLLRFARVKYGFSTRLKEGLEPNVHQARNSKGCDTLQMDHVEAKYFQGHDLRSY